MHTVRDLEATFAFFLLPRFWLEAQEPEAILLPTKRNAHNEFIIISDGFKVLNLRLMGALK